MPAKTTDRATPRPLHGLLAEFASPEDLLEATRQAHEAGYRVLDAYTPYPVEGLAEATGLRRTRLPLLVFAGGVTGCVFGFGLQYWVSAIAYPLNVGGRPLASWPSFVVVAFEMTILFAALAAVFGMFALNGLPRLHHPVFNVESFGLASKDRFFLLIEASDPKFDAESTRAFLESTRTEEVHDVPD